MIKTMYNFFLRRLLVLLQVACLTSLPAPIYATENAINVEYQDVNTMKSNPKLLMKLKYGEVEIELYPNKAPRHVERILLLTNKGFYNGLKFHRVIDGFMVQTGDPKGDGTGSSSEPNLVAEFNDLNHIRGIISMARTADLDSANSQFFIMLGDGTYLDYQYTAFGKVTKGMEFIDMIKKGDPNQNGQVTNPDIIESISVINK